MAPAIADRPAAKRKSYPVTLERTPYQKQVWVKSLIELGGSLNQVAKQSGLSVPTVIAIKRMLPSNLIDLERCKKTVVGNFYGLARASQENITLEKLESSSAYQLMGMASLAVQAARDMEGLNRPVFNVVDIAMNIERLVSQSRERLNAINTQLTSTETPTDQRGELT